MFLPLHFQVEQNSAGAEEMTDVTSSSHSETFPTFVVQIFNSPLTLVADGVTRAVLVSLSIILSL